MALSETRAADRAKMAALLAGAMREAGATSVEVKPCSYEAKRLDVVIVAPGGARIVVDFDGTSSQPNVHVATWNTPDCVFLDPAFGEVNPYHYAKASRVACGLDHLIDQLAADLDECCSGAAYMAHDDSRLVAMAARYAANGWSDPRQPRPNVWSDAA